MYTGIEQGRYVFKTVNNLFGTFKVKIKKIVKAKPNISIR